VIRSVGSDGATNSTRRVRVTVVDDAGSAVVGTMDLAMAPDYRPARLWLQASSNSDCCRGFPPLPFYSLQASGGALIQSSQIGGSTSGTPGRTQYGPGAPLVLGSGTYDLAAWFSDVVSVNNTYVPTGAPMRKCTTSVTLDSLDDEHLEAAFPREDGPCTWGPAPDGTPMP
jgi:hypothetical protein